MIDDVIKYLTEERIKQFEKDKIKGKEYITISKEKLLKNVINFLKEINR